MKQNQLNCERMFEWQLLLSCVSHKKGIPLLFQQSCVHSTKQRGHFFFFFHLKHGHWHHNSRYTTFFFFFKAAILVKCTNTKQISFLPSRGPCKFHISHSFSSQRSIRAWYPMRLSSAVHQLLLAGGKKMLFQYKRMQQLFLFPPSSPPPPYVIQMNIKSYKAFLNILLGLQKSTNTSHGHETLKWSHLRCIDA